MKKPGRYAARIHQIGSSTQTIVFNGQKAQTERIKYLVVVQGKGTTNEKRIETGIRLVWCESIQRWCTHPEDLD